MTRGVVAEFHKSAGGRLRLFAITTLTEEIGHDKRLWIGRTGYDVDYSRTYGCYIWHESSGGGDDVIEVSGPYFKSGDVEVKEEPTTLVDGRDKPPWKSKRTAAIRKRNRTRQMKALPKAFVLNEGEDLIDWLENNAIQDESVYCSTCRDDLPSEQLCEHCWCIRLPPNAVNANLAKNVGIDENQTRPNLDGQRQEKVSGSIDRVG